MKNFNFTKGITHSGVFHADEVFCTALCKILNPEFTVLRVFSVPETVETDTIIFDIGFGQFDHHQNDAKFRENGFKYASFGLLWAAFGHLVGLSEHETLCFDAEFVVQIDIQDNGGETNLLSNAVSSFNPTWDSEASQETAFNNAVNFAFGILQREFSRIKSAEKGNKIVSDALKSYNGDIVLLDRFVPWHNILVPSTAKFVIFPSLRGGYNATAVPQELGSKINKISFPEDWRGKTTEELGDIVNGMTFCHPSGFMISCNTKEQCVDACNLAKNAFSPT